MTAKPELLTRIEQTFSLHTPSEKRVASWLLTHAAQIPFETADSIGKATGTSGITVGRYLRKIGYRNLEDVKASLRELPGVPYQPWGMNERLDSWQQQQQLPDRARQSLSLEIDAIAHVYQLAKLSSALSGNWRRRKRYMCWGSSRHGVSPTLFSVTSSICGPG